MPIDSLTERDDTCRTAQRRALRRDALARRKTLGDEDLALRSQAICRLLAANFPQLAVLRVGFCWPVNNEPDVRAALETWRAAGDAAFAALLPVVVEANTALAFRAWQPGMALSADRYGIPTPVAGDFLQPQALLSPLTAFDTAGFRLGYGGGYFDRTLAGLRPRPLAIGVGFELSRVESVFPEPHDERLDAVVTEERVIAFSR
jgi:5,10-methenyltetrahydrofolate synthetase